MSKRIKNSVVALLVMSVICQMTTANDIFAQQATQQQSLSGLPLKDKFTGYSGSNIVGEYASISNVSFYNRILEEYEENNYQDAKTEIMLNESGFFWNKDIPFKEYEVNISEEGLYSFAADYELTTDSSNPAIRSISIDGKYPFVESNSITFYRYFKDKGEPIINSLGDETRPQQIEISEKESTMFVESSGFATLPLKYYFPKGKHTIKFEYIQQDMMLSNLRLVPPVQTKPYSELKAEYATYKPADKTITFEAETNTTRKNNPTVRRENSGDPTVTPRSTTNRLLNTVGGRIWKTGNQSISWEFEVPEDGLYKIGLRVQQNYSDGLPAFRQIEIDGEVPCEELLQYKFDYSTDWYLEELKDNNNQPMSFYLAKGTHALTMRVKFGEMTSVIEALNDDSMLLSDILLDITLLAGSTPDPNYDYGFFDKIPDLEENLKKLSDSMQAKYDYVKTLSGKNPAMASNFLTIKSQLEVMLKDPFKIARQINDLTTAQSSLSQWYLDLQSQSLMIDKFLVGNPNEVWKNEKAGIFAKVKTMLDNFFVSFIKDYDNIGSIVSKDVEIKNVINVWIARGTEWAEVIKEMADEEFTPETGIMINVNVLPSSQLSAGSANALMLSITSGRAPDVAMGVDAKSPVEFAIRDAVYDLSKMSGFDEVKERFVDGLMVPYEYNDGVFALPETMDFNVLIYRKDILNEIGLKVPDTWEELYSYVLPVLYQNGMEFYHPRGLVGDFTPFLFQNGGEFYTPDGLKSMLDTPEAYKAFVEFTELYTNYGVPQEANFYNRMRQGVMPIGIGNFALYMQMSVAAPELAGKWGIAPLPGKKNGSTVDRTTGKFASQASVIMKQSDSPEDAWEYLKWWTSDKVQERFAREVEALVGAEARFNTANINAYLNLAWKEEDRTVFEEMWNWVKETPVVLGGYFTERHLMNAFTTTVVSGGSARDALEAAVKAINRELRMKQEEYGVFQQE